MRSFVSRRGSALLVVLGMLAFMVVSAVAFSAYMRRARLPSNYLRRATSSRELVKAALARAIDDIDHAVNDNPHPGLGTQQCNRHDLNTDTGNTNRNGWVNRVFMNYDMSTISSKDDVPNGAADPNDTVSVLSLEGLAYVPAPLQGEARYYSRRTPTAKWQSFDFDAGRYAYFALDVSDYFDVNRMFAGLPRSSAANTRLTLSYLFEDDDGKVDTTSAKAWDDKLVNEETRQVDTKTRIIDFKNSLPLTSVADMNLLIGTGSYGPFRSWFSEYINGYGKINKPEGDKDPQLMPLITDACPTANDVAKSRGGDANQLYDLSNPEAQPFKGFDFSREKPYSLEEVDQLCNSGGSAWFTYLSLVGMCALCDYLDPDHVPTSLAIPTVERTPMICGFKLTGAKTDVMKITKNQSAVTQNPISCANMSNPQNGDTCDATVTVTYRIDLSGLLESPAFEVAAVFPFAHEDDDDKNGWTIDGRFSLFFTEGEIGLRTRSNNDILHLTDKTISSGISGDAVLNMKLQPPSPSPSFSVPKNAGSLGDAFKDNISLEADVQPITDLAQNKDFITVTYKWQQTYVVPQGSTTGNWDPAFQQIEQNPSQATTAEAKMGLALLNGNGVAQAKKSWDLQAGENVALNDMRLNAAVWLRVQDSKKYIVDMVPACIDDDSIQNNLNSVGMEKSDAWDELGHRYPLMLLDTNGGASGSSGSGMASLTFNSLSALDTIISTQNGGVPASITANSFFVKDPRYNYAPEFWYQNGNTLSSWVGMENGNAFGNSGLDIFFATSDAGYLQSPYELSNLPYVTELNTGNKEYKGKRMPDSNDMGAATLIGRTPSVTLKYPLYWKNYEPRFNIPINLESLFPFYTSYQGQRVNPYSDNMEVIRAVFSNTPLDWKRASTNNMEYASPLGDCAGSVFKGDLSFSEFSEKYVWSEGNTQESNAQIKREEVENFTEAFITQMKKNSMTWDDLLADMLDDSQPDQLADKYIKQLKPTRSSQLTNAKLYKSDRDFLYGYWRDCFAVRQQLYLIFVRAEPLMLGGESAGATPPQLGGRAVALVWRDPTAVGNQDGATCPGYPHPTRILFYKNLE